MYKFFKITSTSTSPSSARAARARGGRARGGAVVEGRRAASAAAFESWGLWGGAPGAWRGLLEVCVSDPEHDVVGDAAVLGVKEVCEVFLGVAEGPVDENEGGSRVRADEGVELRVVRVALSARGLVEFV